MHRHPTQLTDVQPISEGIPAPVLRSSLIREHQHGGIRRDEGLDCPVLDFGVLPCGQGLSDLEIGQASHQVCYAAGGQENGPTSLQGVLQIKVIPPSLRNGRRCRSGDTNSCDEAM